MNRIPPIDVDLPGSEQNAVPGTAPGAAFLLVLLCLAATAGAVVLFATSRHPVGVNADSVIYLDAAQRLSRYLSYSAFQYGEVKALTHFPPLLSLLLAPFDRMGWTALDGARWLNVGLFAATIASVAWIAFRLTSRRAVAVACALVVLASSDVFQMYATVRSEAVFLPLVLWSVYLLSAHIVGSSRRDLVLAAVCAALASLARYPGIVLAGAGAVVILGMGSKPLTDRIRRALLFGVISAGPLFAWLTWNKLASGSATNRELALHPGGIELFYQFNQTISSWLLPLGGELTAIRFVLSAGILATLVFSVGLLLRKGGAARAFTFVALSFSGFYLVLLLLSIALADAQTPLNGRHLLPVFLMSVLLAGSAAALLLERRTFLLRLALTFAGLVMVAVPSIMTKKLANRYHAVGYGYTSARWRRANLHALLAKARPGAHVYANAPEVIYFLTGQPAREIPAPRNRWTRRSNVEYSGRVKEMAADVTAGGMVVFLDGIPRRFVPEIPELAKQLGRQPEAWLPNIAVFGPSLRSSAAP